MNTENFAQILEIARHAPSGENCQPWSFAIRGNIISVYNLPDRDTSLYSWGQRASYIAHGALLENIRIAATHFQLNATTALFPDPRNQNHVADIELAPGNTQEDPLFMYISQRCSNRKPYKNSRLASEQQNTLSRISPYSPAAMHFTDDPEAIKRLARIAGNNEKILFSNRHLHNFFFNHINWSSEQENKKRIGFYTKTLELPPPALLMFKLCRHWHLQELLNMVGCANLIGSINASIYGTAPFMGIITIPTRQPEDFVAAGETLQRLWLTVTSLGLSMQLMTGLLFLKLKIDNRETEHLKPWQTALVTTGYGKIQKIFSSGDRTIALLFRIGMAEQPSAHALKLPANITYT